MEQQNTLAVFGSYLAKKLLKDGEKLIDIDKDHSNPGRIVFYFLATDNVKQAIAEEIKQKKKWKETDRRKNE